MTEFVGMVVINGGIAVAYVLFLRQSDDPTNRSALVFFVLLLTLILTLFDRYRPLRVARFGRQGPSPQPA